MKNSHLTPTRKRDPQMEWANSAGLPILLVALTVTLTATLLPDDLPFDYSQVDTNQVSMMGL